MLPSLRLRTVVIVVDARIEESRYRSAVWMSYDGDRVQAAIEQGVIERLVMRAADDSLLCLASEQALGWTATNRISRPPKAQ